MKPTHTVKILPSAENDMDRICRVISADKPAAAKMFLKKIKKAVLDLKNFPRRGSPCHIMTSTKFHDLRFLNLDGYLIFYDVRGKNVVVLRVAGPGLDWMHLFA